MGWGEEKTIQKEPRRPQHNVDTNGECSKFISINQGWFSNRLRSMSGCSIIVVPFIKLPNSPPYPSSLIYNSESTLFYSKNNKWNVNRYS